MSAATTFPEIKDVHLQNLLYALLTSTRNNGTNALAAGFTDRLGNPVVPNSQQEGAGVNPTSQASPAREVEVTLHVNPDGLTCSVKIVALSPSPVQSVVGSLDTAVLAGQIGV